MKNDP
jgi:hypothetical protein